MTFRVGQKVVCVDDTTPEGFDWYKMPIKKGAIYTVSQSGLSSWLDGAPAIHLSEVKRSVPFWASRFRPVVERKTDISFAHEILRKASKPARGPVVALQHRETAP